MKYVSFILMSLFLMSCNEKSQKAFIANDLYYYKDTKTNLCFAGYSLGYDDSVFTNVPCTEKVEKLIK